MSVQRSELGRKELGDYVVWKMGRSHDEVMRLYKLVALIFFELLRIMDRKACYCVYATINRICTFFCFSFFLRVAPVLEDIRLVSREYIT